MSAAPPVQIPPGAASPPGEGRTAVVDSISPRARELFLQMRGANLYREAYKKGLNLSRFLEEQDPSANYRDGLDAFSRLMLVAGIRSKSDPANGYWADPFTKFDQDDNSRALVPEWAARQWRKVSFPQTRTLFSSTQEALGSVMRPYADSPMIHAPQIAPAVPLASMLAMTTGIHGDSYRAFYMVDVAADQRLTRVAQGADIPKVTFTGSDHTVDLFKYGRALEFTDELVRRSPIDKVAWWVQRKAVQTETDKVATVLDVAINGDGNASTAATNYNLTTLDPAAVAGTLTAKGWVAFKNKFFNPYMMTVALAQEAVKLQLMLLNMGTANHLLGVVGPTLGFGQIQQINDHLSDAVRLGQSADAPALTIVGMDSRFAIERVVETAAETNEVERYAIRQTQALIISEVEGFLVADQLGTKTLTISA
jgi:hypothetical protein